MNTVEPRARTRLRALQAAASRIVSDLDVDATLLSIGNAAADLLDADMVGIISADGDHLRVMSCAGHRNIAAVQYEATRGEGVAGIVAKTGQPYGVDDFRSATEIPERVKRVAASEGVRTALGAPMIVRGEVTGAVMAWSRRVAAFDIADQEVLEGLANLAAIAIHNARLYETVRDIAARLEVANSELRSQYDRLRRAGEVHTELTQLVLRGDGLSAVVDMVARYVGGEAAVFDATLESLVVTPRGQALAERARTALREGVIDDGVLVREVSSGGERLAFLCVGQPSSGELATLIVEAASVVCALELTKQRAVLDAHTRVRSDLVWDLLEGRIHDEAEANVRARYLGLTLPRRLRVLLIEAGGLGPEAGRPDGVDRRRAALLAEAERLAAAAGAGTVLAARRATTLALLVPQLDDAAQARRFATTVLDGLATAEPGLSLAAGVSTCHALSADLRGAWAQARTARSAVPGTGVCLFDDMGVLRLLLSPTRHDDLVDFVRHVLGAVIDYDRRHDAQWLDTLETHLAEDCVLGRTAERLNVHPKTVRYRLGRVRALTGRDLSCQQDCFEVQLALHIKRSLDRDPSSAW